MQIMDIPRLPERLECMLYRRKFDEDIEEIRPELHILREASHELRASKRFKQILQVVISPMASLLPTYFAPLSLATDCLISGQHIKRVHI